MDPFPTLLQALGRQMTALRRQTGLSQEHFADAIKIHRTEMGRLERGTITPRLDTLYKVARGLGLGVSELLALAEGKSGLPPATTPRLPAKGKRPGRRR